jgi:hypothetical protein
VRGLDAAEATSTAEIVASRAAPIATAILVALLLNIRALSQLELRLGTEEKTPVPRTRRQPCVLWPTVHPVGGMRNSL